MSKPPKPTPKDIESARYHDKPSISATRTCECPVCVVRRRAEWENAEMRKLLTLISARKDSVGNIAIRLLEEMDR